MTTEEITSRDIARCAEDMGFDPMTKPYAAMNVSERARWTALHADGAR
jgi:hypothetical protein